MNQNAEHSLSPWYIKIGETVASWSLLLVEVHITPSIRLKLNNNRHL